MCTGQVGAPGKGERDISKEKTDAQGGEVTVVQSHREGPWQCEVYPLRPQGQQESWAGAKGKPTLIL